MKNHVQNEYQKNERKEGNGRETKVYPACAGIHPDTVSIADWGSGLPRMRGDPPSPTF